MYPLQNGFRKQQVTQNMKQNLQNMQNNAIIPNETDMSGQNNIQTQANSNSNNNMNIYNHINKNLRKQVNSQNNTINQNNNNILNNTNHNNNAQNNPISNNQINQQINQSMKIQQNNSQYNNIQYSQNNQNNMNPQLNNNPINNNSKLNYSQQNATLENNNTSNQNIFFINSQQTNQQQNNISGRTTTDSLQQVNQQSLSDYSNSNFYRGENTQVNQENPQTKTQAIFNGTKNEKNLDQSNQEDYQQNFNNYSESTEVSNNENMSNFKHQQIYQQGKNSTNQVLAEDKSSFLPKYHGQKTQNYFQNIQTDKINGSKQTQDDIPILNQKRKQSFQDNTRYTSSLPQQNKSFDQHLAIDEIRKKQKLNMTIITNKADQSLTVASQQSKNNQKSLQQETNGNPDMQQNGEVQQNTPTLSAISPILTASRLPNAASLDLLQGSSYIKGMESQKQLQQLNLMKNSNMISDSKNITNHQILEQSGINTPGLQILAKIASESNQLRRSNSFKQSQNLQNSSKLILLSAVNNNSQNIGQTIGFAANSTLSQVSSIGDQDGGLIQQKLIHDVSFTNDKINNMNNLHQKDNSEKFYPSTPDFSNQGETDDRQERQINNNNHPHDVAHYQRGGQKQNKKQQKQQKRNEKQFNKHKKQINQYSHQKTKDQQKMQIIVHADQNLDYSAGMNSSSQFINPSYQQQISINQIHVNIQNQQNKVYENPQEYRNGNSIEEELINTPVQQKCSSTSSSTIANHNQNICLEEAAQQYDLKASQVTEQGMIEPIIREQLHDIYEHSQLTQEVGINQQKEYNEKKQSDNYIYSDMIQSPMCDLSAQYNMVRSPSVNIMNNQIRMSTGSTHHPFFGGILQSPFHAIHHDYVLVRENNMINIDSGNFNLMQSPNHMLEMNSPFMMGGVGSYPMTSIMLGNQTSGDGAQN